MHRHYPRLLLNERICKSNIANMARNAGKQNLAFRPHFKTHQSHEIGRWFREEGVTKITVSSVKMAAYFASDGWDDIFIAFPVNILEADNISRLAENVTLGISVESVETAEHLSGKLKAEVDVYIKIDTGYHRTGMDPADTPEITRVMKAISGNAHLRFRGFYTHAGHTYHAGGINEIRAISEDSRQQLLGLGKHYSGSYPDLILSSGDTPSCSVVNDFSGIHELRPGNFVFYDLMQQKLGACARDNIAVALECPVVAKNSRRREILVHGGAVHLSKEYMIMNDRPVFGLVVPITPSGWGIPFDHTVVTSLSQEHGIISADQAVFDALGIGDTVGILPVHSCLAANLADCYVTTSGREIPKARS